jgi:hypothetical protein
MDKGEYLFADPLCGSNDEELEAGDMVSEGKRSFVRGESF